MLITKSFLTIGSVFVVLLLSGCVMYGQESGDDLEFSGIESEISYNGHDYLFVATPKTWQQAQTYCTTYNNSNGGGGYRLVTIESPGEEAFLNMNEIARGLGNWWIGYSDMGIEGTWTWTNSGTSMFANWWPNEPNDLNNEDCAVDRFNGADSWNDASCSLENPFVCERDANASGTDGVFTYSRSNTSSATVNAVQVAVYLNAGQVFTVGTCGLPGATGSGDTYLRLRRPGGVEEFTNDDSGSPCGLLSNISIVAPTTGSYVIHAGCFGNSSCSGTVVYNY
ncbi:MAG TPA: C-type lectin domain-containing protein [Kofleriaceae bacterium]|nr:C-type lectin domain-containing protein [Kofleriaceae bacterium]